MHAGTRTLVVALGASLLGGCAALDSLAERLGIDEIGEAPVAVEREPGPDIEPEPLPDPEPVVEEDPAADIPIARPGRPLMREIQAALNERGLDAGPADGFSGPRTVRAIRLFKVARRMEVTDDVTPRLLDELGLTAP